MTDLTQINANTHVGNPSQSGPDSVFTSNGSGAIGTLFANNSTTHSSEDAQTTHTSIDNPVTIHDDLYSNVRTGVDQEIRTFLAKPVLLAAGTLATTDSFISGPVTGDYFPAKPLANNSVWTDKMKGNYLLKGTAVFTFQVNANRFQQGRYILCVILNGGSVYGSQSGGNVSTIKHTLTLTQVTQLPHIEIDLSTDTAGELRVPLSTATGWTSFVASPVYNDVGVWQIQTYSPLVAPSGSTAAEYSVWLHFEDVEVAWPLVPQSRSGIKGKINRKPKTNISEAEASGPISSAFNKISTASNILAGVPILSSIAGPVSWASDIVSQVASVFGWSKPHIDSPYQLVARYVFPKYNNCDSHDTSMKLAVSDRACVEALPGFASSDVDELSIQYVASISAYFTQLSWTTSNATGVNLLSQKISPRNFTYDATSLTISYTAPTPLAFAANFFEMWRGSIVFTIKLVKTEFHSGRLVAAFFPYDYVVTGNDLADPTLANTAYLHREIIDIRNGNEFTFTIPYTSITSYKPTVGTTGCNIGKFLLYVLNPLVAPATVSSTVTVLIEVAGGPDIEFAYPRSQREIPAIGIQPMSGGNKTKEIVSSIIGNSTIKESLAPAKYCIGERVLSFRQLVKRFNSVIPNSPGSSAAYFWYLPFSFYYSAQDHATHAMSTPDAKPDVLSLLSYCYVYYRGSMRWKFVDIDSTVDKVLIAKNVNYFSGNSFNNFANLSYQTIDVEAIPQQGNGTNNSITLTQVCAGVEVEFPYYCPTHVSPIVDMCNNAANVALGNAPMQYNASSFVPPCIGIVYSNKTTQNLLAWRAAGEDFEMGMFMSTPLLINWTNAQ